MVAPAHPTSASSAPAPGAVPQGGDEAPLVVIDELHAAFSLEATGPPPKPALDLNGPDVVEPKTTIARESIAHRTTAHTTTAHTTGAPSTRAMSPSEVVTHIDNAPPRQPAVDLVPEPTRRSTRRSRREAKREAKREKKRLAEHDKAQKKARKQTRRARRKARRKGEVDGTRLATPAPESDVRIITPDDPSVPPIVKPVGSPAQQRPGPPIAITGDDLPDAVYVGGDIGKAAPDEGSPNDALTVFIDEDNSQAGVVTLEVATAAARMEPRIRERRIAVKRAVGRRRLKWIALVSAVVLVAVAVFAVLGSSLFEIKTVRVDGRVYSGGPTFDAVIESLEGANVLRVDTESAERQLEEIPWVADARVSTDFPDAAAIEVREREPSIAYQATDGRYRVLDREGRVLDVITGQPVAYLELFVTGGPAVDLRPGQRSPPGYRAAATLVQALTPEMRARVQSVSADAEATNLQLVLDAPTGGIEVRFGAAEDLVDKLVRLQTVLTDPDPEHVPTEMIDVSGPDLVTR